jgi:preprotein translocase subunit SecG
VLHFVVRRDADVDDSATPKNGKRVEAVKIGLQVLLVIGGLFLTLLILLHKGKGGGLSDMFGGGMSTSLGSSSVAERNLDRFTIAVGIVWFACIVGIGLIDRFSA